MLNEYTIKQICKMTHENDHTHALYTAARGLELNELANRFDDLEYEQRIAGCVTQEIKAKRAELADRLYAAARERLSATDYTRFCRCF